MTLPTIRASMRLFLILATLALSSCATTEPIPPAQKTLALSEADAGEELEALLAAENGEEEDLALESFGDDFCNDNIYAQYLTQQYRQLKPSKPMPSRPSKNRARKRRSRQDYAALYFVKSRLSGNEVAYFGALPVVTNERVNYWMRYFKTTGRSDFMRWLVRGESVKNMVQPLMQEQGVPLELFSLAMVESGFSNLAYSRAKATGTWQFMNKTAEYYGLTINHWIDERRDPIKSTIAAANYLKDLYGEFGDWHLAMAAYNAGPGKVRKAIRLTGTRDYWKLAETPFIPKETKHYVPKILAALLLASNPKVHGFDIKANPKDSLPSTEVLIRRPILLDELAHHLQLPLGTLLSWNPELIRNITPPDKTAYSLRLSSELASLFEKVEGKLSAIQVTNIHLHKVKQGETLSHIARKYKVKMNQLRLLNPSLQAQRVRVGSTIAVPRPSIVTIAAPRHPEAA